MSKKIDYTKLVLEGNGHTQDSFSLTVQAAARLLDVEADYETIYTLSTNAFSPAIDKGEDCTAWWHVQGWLGDEGMATVAGRLGLQASRLDLPPDNLSPADPEDVFERKALEHRKRCAAVLRREMDDGAVVITSGGWKVRTDEGFAPWCWWGVVTKAETDGTVVGACLKATPGRAEGYRDRPLDYLGDTWVLRAGEQAFTAREADLRALRTAVRRIRADEEPFKQTKRSAFGLDAMDVWIEQMRTVRGFCAGCTERVGNGWTDALNNGQTTGAGTKVAAAYLRRIAGAFPETARPRLNAAASHYDHVVELLRPVDYKQFIGDIEKQKAHAESVLVPVKAELAAAADEMEKALAAAGEWIPLAPGGGFVKWGVDHPPAVDGDEWVFTGQAIKGEAGGQSWDNFVLSAEVKIDKNIPEGNYCVQLTGNGTRIYVQLVSDWVLIAYFDENPKGDSVGFTHLARERIDVPEGEWFTFRARFEGGEVTAILDGHEIVTARIPSGTGGMPGLVVNQQHDCTVRVRDIEIRLLRPTEEQLRELVLDAPTNWWNFVEAERLKRVRHEGDRVGIEGVRRLRLGEGRDNQLMGALDVALHAMGEGIGYDHLMGFSGAAFRLHFWMPYWCPSSPDLIGGYNHFPPALEAVGRSFTVVDVIGDAASQEGARAAIVRSIDAGLPVVASNLMGNGRYGVITGYRTSDGALLCRTYDDKSDDYTLVKRKQGIVLNGNAALPDRMLVLGERKRAPLHRESVLRSFEIALELVYTSSYERDGEDQASGFAAFEKWISDLEDDALFEKVEAEHGQNAVEGMADVNGWIYLALLDARAAARRYLRANVPGFGGEARTHIAAAAGIYEQITAKLAEGRRHAPLPWDKEACAAWAASPDTRHAEAGVLREVLALEKRAVAGIEKALAVIQAEEMKAKVKRRGNRVWIEGVDVLTPWGRGRDCSYLESFAVAMRATGEDATYEQIMGISGTAFRLQIRDPEWCTKALDAGVGFDATAPAWQALGYSGKSVFTREGNAEDRKKAQRAIVDSIDRGRPVIAMDLEDGMNWGIIAGYEDDGERLLCRTKSNQEEDLLLPRKWPWLVNVIVEKTPAPNRRETIIGSLRRAVELARTERYAGAPPGEEHYFSGFAGYRKWMEGLREQGAFDGLAPEKRNVLCCANSECYSSLLDARRIAAAYLRSSADGLGDAARGPLLRAADHYESLVRELEEGRATALAKEDRWTAELRFAQADVLGRALALDRQAIDEIEKALAAGAAQEGGGKVLVESAVELFRNGKAWNRVPDTVEGPGPHSYLLMHFLQMRAAGWDDVDLDDVAVLSGASALYAYEHGAFEPKYAYRRNKPDERIAEATGFGYEWKSFADTEGAWQFVKESIASGRPVKGEYGENILFAGYEAAAKPEDRKAFAISDEPETFAKWWTWAEYAKWAETVTGWGFPNLGRYAEKAPASDPKATALRVMENLVAWSSGPPEACRKAHPKATFGLAGIEKYAADCADMEKYPDFRMCHDMNCQWAVRKSTAAYLDRVAEAGLFSDEVSGSLRAAAKEYRAAFDGWVVAFKNIGWGAPKDGGKTKQNRLAATEGLKAALKQERAAIDSIEKALAWADEVPGQVRPAELVEFRLDKTEEQETEDGVWRAHVPSAIVQAMRGAGVDVDYAEVTAASGWAFSFRYQYDNWHVAALPVDQFTALPEMAGFEITSIACGDAEAWEFVTRHIDAGTPVVCTHGDGGLIYGYREREGERQFWFDGCPPWGWIKAADPHPKYDTHSVLARKREARPEDERARTILRNALRKAEPHEDRGTRCGLAGLEAYLADVEDPGKDFEKTGEWFCWATFERLSARRCAAAWLRRAADALGGDAREPLLAAAAHYDKAADCYHKYDEEVHAMEDKGVSFHEWLRTPERTKVIVPILRKGIEAERAGIDEMKRVLGTLGGDAKPGEAF